jgi:hypothetical protein
MKTNHYPVGSFSSGPPLGRLGATRLFVLNGLLTLLVVAFALAPTQLRAVGFWTALNNAAPGGVNTMLLLPDGTVMAQNGGNTTWYRLTPDVAGSYANGSWTTRTAMNYSRLYYSSQVLQDGRVFFAGGEYGNGTTNAEVYTPSSDSWAIIPVPNGLINKNNTVTVNGNNTGGFIDSGSKMLADGTVLIFPVSPFNCGETVIFSPFSNTLFQGPNLFRGCNEDEASCVKLPDDSVLSLDNGTVHSSRYIPASNTIINDADSPVALFDPFGDELGPAFLLPNGKAIFFGSLNNTAIYTPSGSTSPGTWAAGANFPNNQGMPDAPGAMMVNGIILLATTPVPVSTNHFPSPTSYYEYDYSVGLGGTFTRINGPTGLTTGGASYPHRMLVLPNGQVLYTTGGSQLYVYTPSGSPLAAGKPTITGLSYNVGGSIHLTGTLFNGISEGANYGDDAQMDSNYPLVRFTDGGGNVYYGSTFNWSRTSVQTGGAIVSTDCWPPVNLPAGANNLSLQVVANGNASNPISFSGPVWVDFLNYSAFFQFGTFTFPYPTMVQGTNAVAVGGTINIADGFHSLELMTISKPMTIRAYNAPTTIGH